MSDNETKNDKRTAATIPCRLEVAEHEVHDAAELPAILARVFGDRNVAGIVWATNGTGTLLGISSASGGGEATLEVSSSGGFDPSRVYEARVWRVITDDVADDRLAHEFRWVNGVGSRELTLLSVSPDSPARSESGVSADEAASPIGYARRITYMQHDPHRGPLEEEAKPKAMSAIEYITEETAYGNTTVTDQLFTGEWHENA